MNWSIPKSKLALARLVQGKSQTQVSVAADVSCPTLSAAENLIKIPSERVRNKLAKYYARTWEDLYKPVNLADLL